MKNKLWGIVLLALVACVILPACSPAPKPTPPTAEPTVVPPTAGPTVAPPTAEPTVVPPTAEPTAVPPTAEPTEIPLAGFVQVVSGDTLWDLACISYITISVSPSGSALTPCTCWPGIYRANLSLIDSPQLIYPGWVLGVPIACIDS